MSGLAPFDRLAVSANGVEYVVVVTTVYSGGRWEAVDEGSFNAERRFDRGDQSAS